MQNPREPGVGIAGASCLVGSGDTNTYSDPIPTNQQTDSAHKAEASGLWSLQLVPPHDGRGLVVAAAAGDESALAQIPTIAEVIQGLRRIMPSARPITITNPVGGRA
jgi:hypothetical protein